MENSRTLKYGGTVVWVDDVQKRVGKNGSEFVYREFVISPNPEDDHPTMLKLTLKKSAKEDRTKLVTEKCKGRECGVEFFPDARFWDDPKTGKKKVFCDNVAWKVEWLDGADAAPAPAEPPEDVANAEDDMPF